MAITVEIIEKGDEAAIKQIVSLSGVFTNECLLFRTLVFDESKCSVFTHKVQQCGDIILACVDGVAAGYSAVVEDDTVTEKPRLEMVTFYVHPSFRNSGVGAALADKVVELIDERGNGYSQLAICAYFENDREIIQRATELLFKRRGFKQVGVILGKMGDEK